MTDKTQRPYRISQEVQAKLRQKQTRYWKELQRQRPLRQSYYWLRNLRTRCRNLIRGDLVAHRRMFGVSHKHVQAGASPPEHTD